MFSLPGEIQEETLSKSVENFKVRLPNLLYVIVPSEVTYTLDWSALEAIEDMKEKSSRERRIAVGALSSVRRFQRGLKNLLDVLSNELPIVSSQ
jgi:hypothetical protein